MTGMTVLVKIEAYLKMTKKVIENLSQHMEIIMETWQQMGGRKNVEIILMKQCGITYR